MPLVLLLGIAAVVVAVAVGLRQGEEGQARRVIGTAAGLWIALIVAALAVLTVGTLRFGR